MSDIIRVSRIIPEMKYSFLIRAKIKAMSERDEMISRLVSIFPNNKKDVYANIRNIEIKTRGIKWCIDYALSGKTWEEIEELLS